MEDYEMFQNENDLKKLLNQLNIETDSNPAHRENLRRQMLSAFSEGQQPKTTWQSIIKSPITKLAAAVIIIAIGLFLVHQGPSEPVETTKAVKVAKSPAEMMTAISLTIAYRRGGLEAVEQQCEKAIEMLGPRPKSISVQELLEDFNSENSERTKL